MNLKPLSLASRILCYIVFLHFIHIHFIRPCYCVFIYVCICVHLTDFLKTSLMKLLAVNCMSERASKSRFLKPDKLKNHSNEGKGKKKKKEREEGKGKKRKKRNGCAR